MYYLNILTLLLLVFPKLTHAAEMKEGEENYCHDTEAFAKNQELPAKHPSDSEIIRLLALRDGLCGMIDRGQITAGQGIDIFTDEQNKSAVRRSNKKLTKERLA